MYSTAYVSLRFLFSYKQDEEGRSLIDPFVELPSKEEYPEYYDYITEPIDMNMIEEKVQADRVRYMYDCRLIIV